MTLKDLLKKREKTKENHKPTNPSPAEFIFIRSTTNTQEVISPPSFASEKTLESNTENSPNSNRRSRFRASSATSTSSRNSNNSEKRLPRLHLRSRSHASSASSANVPSDLPIIKDGGDGGEDGEAMWEERATLLAQKNPNTRSRSSTLPEKRRMSSFSEEILQTPGEDGDRPTVTRSVGDAQGDENIQEAISLHESGDLLRSTAMFGRLAESNVLAQILYGLALRHGWGIPQNPSLAVTYLSQAASNSADVESQALAAGIKKGGAAKGELVLAIYELANSFRHGWGVEKDPVAARSYYETAANLGDTDAMNEVARCYEEGFGGKKDKYTAAKYYRLAEEHGSKTLGNSWISGPFGWASTSTKARPVEDILALRAPSSPGVFRLGRAKGWSVGWRPLMGLAEVWRLRAD
ncbi:hypothetical protein MMC07_004725 [Pseudocyphellaria aurata]|nr:hypothetical protein [Pseudocyphellaria aurata]